MENSSVLLCRMMALTGYEGSFSRWGGDGHGDVDGVAVEASLTGPGGVLQVISIFLLLSSCQATPHRLQRRRGGAILLSIWCLLPGERDVYLITDMIIFRF